MEIREAANRWKAQEKERAVHSRIEDAARFEELVDVRLLVKRKNIVAVPEAFVDLKGRK